MKITTIILAIVSLGAIGTGLGWWIHPGLGMVVVGACVWADLTINSIISRPVE